jgi:hypothetical protein
MSTTDALALWLAVLTDLAELRELLNRVEPKCAGGAM